MSKRRPSFDERQLAFDLQAQPAHNRDGALAGLEKRVSSSVAHILNRDTRNRFQVAAEISRLLDDDVSKSMLDKYTSESADAHNISASRFLALILATGAYDILRQFVLEIGADLVMGDEILTAELGSIEASIAALSERKKAIKSLAKPMNRFGGGQ